MQQVFVIHGGNAFEAHEEYIADLASRTVSLEDLGRRGWKGGLADALGAHYVVYAPRMPNAQNARYAEWKIWFEKFVPLLDASPIFVGHSLGGVFLAKYLSEERYPKPIKATFLVAAPANTIVEPYADFNLGNDLSLFEEQGGAIHLYHSTDDMVVPYSALLHYQRALPNAKVHPFEGRGHFLGEEFPEIVDDIRALA